MLLQKVDEPGGAAAARLVSVLLKLIVLVHSLGGWGPEMRGALKAVARYSTSHILLTRHRLATHDPQRIGDGRTSPSPPHTITHICTHRFARLATHDPQTIEDGRTSYPSGHAAEMFAVFTVLSLYLCGKARLFVHAGPVSGDCGVALPLLLCLLQLAADVFAVFTVILLCLCGKARLFAHAGVFRKVVPLAIATSTPRTQHTLMHVF